MAWFRCTSGSSAKTPFVFSTAQQYVALPLYDDDNYVLSAKIFILANNSQSPLIGDGQWSTSSLVLYTESNAVAYRYNANGLASPVPTPSGNFRFIDIEINGDTGILTYDGNTYGGTPVKNHWQVGLFGQSANGMKGRIAIAELTVYKSGNLYMHLIPKRISGTDNGYLYDTVSGQDYPSLTSTPLGYSEY